MRVMWWLQTRQLLTHRFVRSARATCRASRLCALGYRWSLGHISWPREATEQYLERWLRSPDFPACPWNGSPFFPIYLFARTRLVIVLIRRLQSLCWIAWGSLFPIDRVSRDSFSNPNSRMAAGDGRHFIRMAAELGSATGRSRQCSLCVP